MRQDEQVSRYEVNRNVRMVLTRHDGDLTRIDYSFMGSTVYLSGELAKPTGNFTPKDIENIIREIAALPHVRDVQFDLGNWIITPSGDSWQIKPLRKEAARKAAYQTSSTQDSTVVIEKEEDLEVVLEDIEAGEKKINPK